MSIFHKAGTFCQNLAKEGLAVLKYKTEYKLEEIRNSKSQNRDYMQWIAKHETDRMKTEKLDYNPLISVVIPVYNVETPMLEACIESVLGQTYSNFELCLADDHSTMESVRTCLARYEKKKKVKIVYREENGHISRCTNSAIELAEGEFIAFMDCDDVMAPNALYEVARKLNEDRTLDFIYSDEDKIEEDGGNRHEPHFKPDWSPDTFMSLMYTCHLGVYRRTIGEEIGWLRTGYEGAQDYDFTLRFTEKTDRIGHIPKILYHWRERKESTAVNPEAKQYILETAKKAKEDALERRGYSGRVEYIPEIYQYRVIYDVPQGAMVSVIIPSKDNFEIFKRCVDTLKAHTNYKNYEIILVDNGSGPEQKAQYAGYCEEGGYTYHYEPMEFNFSHMCNVGAKLAKGRFLLFLNDDISVDREEGVWMERMAGHAALPYIGAVGAKLLYPDTTLIQHIGVISFDAGPVHSFGQYDDTPIYYFCRNKIEYNYSAVTAACVMIDAAKFWEVGGFDESFAVAYNDVDLCYNLNEKGYYCVSRMDAVLYHHESLSRGDDVSDPVKMKRLLREREHLYRNHPQYIGTDPFYSPNLTMHRADCSISGSTHVDYLPLTEMTLEEFEALPTSECYERGIRYAVANALFVMVDGWAFKDGQIASNWRHTELYFVGTRKHKVYHCTTTQNYTDAMPMYAKKRGHYNLCAFLAVVKRGQMEPDNYRLYLARDGKVFTTTQELDILEPFRQEG